MFIATKTPPRACLGAEVGVNGIE
ncbi:uncharacterized protein DNG_06722 [Cephalotrichum gorgonifer]|uniref:Uncharacterized protein n=1 Tax=Cephalotrichum gorgonifer TaxID=2041049 RepID=A0AAE8N226_9PEZI|nr:uncharacterized protein DNG_06722 [Cephalotrichum gorgonifer]